ncbi:MAG: phenylacetate--CoA ligase [Candidatus Methanomethyliaceae archaeon]|nr:phenylacetate--CoA ligase [Candidatus Methanomethyliaceae archaeon]
MNRTELRKLQNKKIIGAFKRAKGISFLRQKIKEKKLEKFSGIQDLEKLPFTVKKDIAECFPFGALAVPLSNVVRIHTSSGSTGKPITTFYTQNDIQIWSELMARGLACTGARRGDIFQNTTSQGFFTGGLGLIQGAEMLGLTVVPLGSANAEKQLETMKDFNVTIFHAIPSFALRLIEAVKAQSGLRESLKLRIAVLGAEPWTKEMRTKIEDGLKIKAFNNYGFAEVGGPGVAIECQAKSGLHIWEDHFLAEVIDPKTGESLELEEEGELVITPLSREAMPLLRYRTGDITRFIDGKCDCGRTHRKIDWFRGRIDDMIKVRGIGIYPSNIEKIIASHKEANGNFQILISGIDDITVKAEACNSTWQDQAAINRLRKEIFEEIKDATLLRTNVEILAQGTLPRSEGKAKRVVDMRKLF